MAPPPSNPQEIQQLLSFLLSQPGPNSVPYQEPTKWLITQHLLNLISSYPSLTPKTATFMHNDGRPVTLLQADGTIPMLYQGVTYNIPVIIWLLESYPYHPPCVYVNPTPDMIIKHPHAHVTPSGLVSLPYLQHWVHPSSNLVHLVSELSAAFACDPPLYSRLPPDQSLSTTPSPYQHVHHHHHQQSDDVAEEKERLEQQLQGKMLEGTASDLPIQEGAVSSLGNSFQHGAVPFDPYSSRYVKAMLLREQQFSSFPFMG